MALRLTAASSQYLDITSGLSGFPANTPWTIAGWIYLVTNAGADNFYFLSLSADGTFSNGDIFNIASGNRVRLTSADEAHHAGQATDDNAGSFSTGTWYFFAASYDGTGIQVSIDGSSLFTSTLSLVDRDPITSITLGRYVGGGSTYSDMRFWGWKAWTESLDLTAVTAEMAQAWPVHTSNVWAYWDFELTSRPGDDSGNGHTWTEHASPTDEAAPAGIPLINPDRGTSNKTIGAVTISAAGTVASSAGPTGSVTQTLGACTITATGVVLNPISGALTQTLQPVTVYAYQNAPTFGRPATINGFRAMMQKLKRRRAAQRGRY